MKTVRRFRWPLISLLLLVVLTSHRGVEAQGVNPTGGVASDKSASTPVAPFVENSNTAASTTSSSTTSTSAAPRLRRLQNLLPPPLHLQPLRLRHRLLQRRPLQRRPLQRRPLQRRPLQRRLRHPQVQVLRVLSCRARHLLFLHQLSRPRRQILLPPGLPRPKLKRLSKTKSTK